MKYKIPGVILLRIPPKSIDDIYNKLYEVLNIVKDDIEDSFIVVDEEKIRIRKLK